MKSNPYSMGSSFWFGIKIGLSIGWATPWFIVGVILCMTIFAIPVGVACFAIGAAPFTRLQYNRVQTKLAWEGRDRPMDNNEEVPWVM